MPRTLIAIAALLCSAAGPPAAGLPILEGFTKLTGAMRIMSEDYTDPGPGSKKDRVGIYVDGAAAKQIYNAMPAIRTKTPPEYDFVIRRAGNFECLKYFDGSYTCSVAIILTNGKTAYAAED